MKNKNQNNRFIFSRAVKENWPEFEASASWDYGRKRMLPCYVEFAFLSGRIPPRASAVKNPASAFILHLVLSGTYFVSTLSADLELHSGEAVFFEPGTAAKEYTKSVDGTQLLAITFSGSLVPGLLSSLHLAPLTVIRKLRLERLLPLHRKILTLLTAKKEEDGAQLGALLFEILYELASGSRFSTGSDELADLVRVLDTVLPADNPLDMVCERMNLTRPRLERLMRRFFDEPPMRYLIRRRLERAAELLSSTELPVQEIAARVGYHPPTRFCFVFRKTYGVTPLAYRRSRRREERKAIR